MEWQYNGVAHWIEIIRWCSITFGIGNTRWYTNGWETIYFTHERDYAWFLLRWA